MKRCEKCGIITPDDSLMTCQNCGQQFPEPVSQPQPVQSAYQQPAQPAYQQPAQPAYQQPAQPAYQQPAQPAYQQPAQPVYQQPSVEYAPQGAPYAIQPEMPMKWYKALIYAILFISMLLNFTTAYKGFTGSAIVDQYNSEMRKFDEDFKLTKEQEQQLIDEYYETFPGLKSSDIFIAVCAVISIGIAIYVRQQLAHFKKNAPKLIVAYYCFNIIVSIMYIIWQYCVLSEYLDNVKIDESALGTIVLSIVMAIANYVYFKKREHLFCN